VDDGYDNRDSNSIVHQKEILASYAKDNGFGSTRYYIDDGVTGTVFRRPGLDAMLEEVRADNVAVILIKDSSRIGRDVLEVGLLKRTLEEHNVRLVAVNGDLDTAKGFDIMSIFRDVFNEYFVAETSRKIRDVFAAIARAGKHPGIQAPYGYMPSVEDKFVWAIDEPAAQIVREVYKMCIDGMGPYEIAKALRARQVKIPLAHKAERDGKPTRRELMFEDYNWTHKTICAILENREYIGTAIMSRITTKSYKDHRSYVKPEDEWVCHEGAHPAIIDNDTFEVVQRIRQSIRRRTKLGDLGVLNGMMFCRDCGARMHIKRQSKTNKDGTRRFYTYYVCRNSRGHTDHPTCTHHSVRQDEIEQLALGEIRSIMAFVQKNENAFAEKLNATSSKESIKAVKKA
jgi:DNA invertase Pin-like site-specific DNA recombinase